MDNQFAKGICHVHYYVYKDMKERDIYFCSKCDAWICTDCKTDLLLRAEAMVKKTIAEGNEEKKGFSKFPVFFEGNKIN